jgi:dCTP deaminase
MGKNSNEVRLRTKGILPVQRLKLLCEAGVINGREDYPIEDNQFQPNSIDLRLGDTAHRVRCSFLPENETVEQKIEKLHQYTFSIRDGAILEPNCVYIIPLLEELSMPESHFSPQQKLFNGKGNDGKFRLLSAENLSAKANPKSTTGRLDIFTRVITDYSHRFEEIEQGYTGKLYLEVVPKSFPIKVRTGHRLNQLRIRHGYTTLSDQDLLRIHNSDPILFNGKGEPLSILKISRSITDFL